MAKTINWTSEFYDEVVHEDVDTLRTAFRLGSIYHENGYYTPGEIVDIRVDGKVVRKGEITGDTELVSLKDISEQDLQAHKMPCQTRDLLITYLSLRYNQPVDENTCVTIIRYRNHVLVNSEDFDDPHM